MRFVILLILSIFFACNKAKISKLDIQQASVYLNHHDSVAYVGKETCKKCHLEIYNSFMETGMGQSFDVASKNKSMLDENDNLLIYDQDKNLYYQPFWKNDSLYISEFRLKDKDTIHKLEKKIDYIIGSGQHTNSHLFSINGYLHQLPYTFYTQEKKADLPPGYEDGNNSRFSRKIGMECISCHNAYPNYIEGSINKYHSLPSGIDCERCHGPGEVHVKRKLSGEFIDTSKYIDYSIVNPAKLNKELQFDICSRCHLQGISILKNGKKWNDFKPGEKLNHTMDIFLSKHENNEDFIMASHVDRLKQSSCFTQGDLTCISCHDPHKSVLKKSGNFFNNKCNSCHSTCKTNTAENIDCISCHMPKSSSIDIPHVTITDHKISVHKNQKDSKGIFKGLICVNNENPTNLSKAKAYIEYYENSTENGQFYIPALDTALKYLDKCSLEESFVTYIHYFYTRKEFKKLIKHFENNFQQDLERNFTLENIGWTYFWLAESYLQFGLNNKAYLYYKKSIHISPKNIDFLLKTAVLEMKINKYILAEERLLKIIKLYPNSKQAHFNLGSLYLNQNNFEESQKYFNKAKKLDPDYKLAIRNLEYLKSINEK